jgi:[acyl-carrier-protein] S-malonyltransferase
MAEALGANPPAAPFVPVVANVTASPVSDAGTIRDLLVSQVTGRVRWRESVGAMEEIGVGQFVEFGGKVLSPMVKRSASGEVETASLIAMDDIEAFLKTL